MRFVSVHATRALNLRLSLLATGNEKERVKVRQKAKSRLGRSALG